VTQSQGQTFAVEYQGEHHYFDILIYGQHQEIMARDAMKAALCSLSGLKLIEVPFWLANFVEPKVGPNRTNMLITDLFEGRNIESQLGTKFQSLLSN